MTLITVSTFEMQLTSGFLVLLMVSNSITFSRKVKHTQIQHEHKVEFLHRSRVACVAAKE